MHCSVKSCNINDDRFLWKCEFCDKSYHAACVGVQRHQEHFISSYMIPLCADCQHHLKTGIDTRKVLCQQEQLISCIKSQTDANLRVAGDLNKLSAIGELFENIEHQLKESVINVNKNTSSKVSNAVSTLSRDIEFNSVNKADELTAIKNHITSLFNISMETTKRHIMEYVDDLTLDLTRELKKICNDVQNLSSLTMDMAAHCNEHNTSRSLPTSVILEEFKSLANTVGGDILKEIQSLSSVINTVDSNINNARLPPVESPPSLMVELAGQSINTADLSSRQNVESTEGWRTLGLKKVWRSDWADYDLRKRRRIQQQKARDKAMKRRKANKKQRPYCSNNNNNNINNNSSINKKNYKTINNVDSLPTCSYNYNSNNNNNNNNGNRHFYNNNTNYNNSNNNNNNNNYNQLPPDRDLIAAAKDRFSRPPPSHRPIHFQRGEILNPYPTDDAPALPSPSAPSHSSHWVAPMALSAAPCMACTCKHSCFPRN